ncbi:helix-turn-helix domain-containing protein [Ralstonia mannitolilytica]
MAIYFSELVMHYMVSMVQKTEIVNDEGSENRASIGARLKEERERLGFSQPAFAAIGGASKGSQLSWEKGTATPNAEFLHEVARVGVDVLYVITGRRNVADMAADEQMVLQGYRQLDARGRAGVLALISGMQAPAATSIRVGGNVGQYFEGDQTGEVKIDMTGSRGKKKR